MSLSSGGLAQRTVSWSSRLPTRPTCTLAGGSVVTAWTRTSVERFVHNRCTLCGAKRPDGGEVTSRQSWNLQWISCSSSAVGCCKSPSYWTSNTANDNREFSSQIFKWLNDCKLLIQFYIIDNLNLHLNMHLRQHQSQQKQNNIPTYYTCRL